MTTAFEISRQTIIQLTGRLLNLGLGLVAVAIMTRALGQTGFGHYTTITAFLQFIALLSGFGLGMVVGREIGRDSEKSASFLGQIIGFRLTTAILIFAISPLLAWLLGYDSFIISGIALTSLGFLASSLTSTLMGVFQAKLRSTTLVYIDLIGKLTLLLGVITAAYAGWRVTGYLIIFVLANGLTGITAYLMAKKLIPFKIGFRFDNWKKIWNLTWPIALTTTFNVFYFKADTVILSLFKSAEEVALYGAAYHIVEVLLGVPAIIGGLVMPILAKHWHSGNVEETKNLYHGTTDALLAGGLAVLVTMLAVGEPLMSTIAGTNFAVSGKILAILSLAILCSFVGNAAGYAIFALDKQKQLIPIFGGGAIIGLTSYFLLIPTFTYWGAAWGTVIVEFLVNLGMIAVLWRAGLKMSPKRWPNIIVATLMLGLGLIIPAPLIVKLILGGGLWLMALWWLKLLPNRYLVQTQI